VEADPAEPRQLHVRCLHGRCNGNAPLQLPDTTMPHSLTPVPSLRVSAGPYQAVR
jgi:hypothetical protein